MLKMIMSNLLQSWVCQTQNVGVREKSRHIHLWCETLSIVSGTDQFLLQELDPLLSQKLKHPVFMLPNVEFMQLQDLCALSPLTPQAPIKILDQSEPAPTSAPAGMDGALIGFCFLSLCHPRLTFFLCPFSALSQPWSEFFFGTLFSPCPLPTFFFPLSLIFLGNFILSPIPTQFLFFFFWNFSHRPTYYPPLSPTDLFTYIFKLKVDSSPSTSSPINLKCVTFNPTQLPTHPTTNLPTNTFNTPIKPHLHGYTHYLVGNPIESLSGRKRSRKNKMKILHGTRSCSLSKINKGKIKVIVIPLV